LARALLVTAPTTACSAKAINADKAQASFTDYAGRLDHVDLATETLTDLSPLAETMTDNFCLDLSADATTLCALTSDAGTDLGQKAVYAYALSSASASATQFADDTLDLGGMSINGIGAGGVAGHLFVSADVPVAQLQLVEIRP
jgi:hypothetical protein